MIQISRILAVALLAVMPAWAKVDQVIIAFKTHFDIGYTDLASNVVARYRTTMIDEALAVCDQNQSLPPEQQFVWTMPGWPLHKIAEPWPGQNPARQQRIQAAFKSGRFAVHALPFTTHTELLEPEDLVRGLGYATELARASGLNLPRDAKMTDVPCHSWILPTLLRHAGVDFLHLGCNAASRSPAVPELFWWEGPDGSRLLTMYTAESYGTGLVPPANWPYRSWLALIHTGDNHGPPKPQEVQQLLQEAARKLPGIKVRIGRLSDFGDALLAESPVLPVVRGDMPDTWIHGPMCDPAGARIARNTRPEIAMAESLGTHLRAWGKAVDPARDIVAGAYENSLLYGEHTWGGALYWVTQYAEGRRFNYGEVWRKELAAGRFKRLEDSWAEHTHYIERAQESIRPLLSGHLAALAGAVNVSGRRIVVFNPLPWPRDGMVRVPFDGRVPRSVRCVDSGVITPVDQKNGLLEFLARQVPASGYRTYVAGELRETASDLVVDATRGVLENRFFKITVHPSRGLITSMIDKASGREWVDPGTTGFGQYLYERFDARDVAQYVKAYVKIDAAWATNELGKPAMPPVTEAPYRALSPTNFETRFTRSAASAVAECTAAPGGALSHGVQTRVVVYPDQPYLDLELTLQNKPADPWPEAGWICLPVKAQQPSFRLGRLGGIVDPTRDIVPGANRHLFAIHTGILVGDPATGFLGICALDSPLASLDTPGCWKYSRDFVPRKPVVYFNLFNNQWTTNFRLWNSGTWTSRIRVWVTGGGPDEAMMITRSWEARSPLQAAIAVGEGGTLPSFASGLSIGRPGVMVTAFALLPDGKHLLRLWEQAGRFGPCEVLLPAGLSARRARKLDLRGQPQGEAIPIAEHKFGFELRAFAPATFALEN